MVISFGFLCLKNEEGVLQQTFFHEGVNKTPTPPGVVYSWGRAGIAADIRYTFGTP
jgi:hypothetical protein